MNAYFIASVFQNLVDNWFIEMSSKVNLSVTNVTLVLED